MGWTMWSYLGGVSWNLETLGESWFTGLGRRYSGSSVFEQTGRTGCYFSSTASSQYYQYAFSFADKTVYLNYSYLRSNGFPVRCIEILILRQVQHYSYGFNITALLTFESIAMRNGSLNSTCRSHLVSSFAVKLSNASKSHLPLPKAGFNVKYPTPNDVKF